MDPTFALDHSRLARNPGLVMAGALSTQRVIDSNASFNAYCRKAIRVWAEQFRAGLGKTSARFGELLARIEQGGEGVIRTAWGGVVVTAHEPPQVEKYLVIRRGGYLALETHELKDERLKIEEGVGLLLSRRSIQEPLAVRAVGPGDEFHFEPGMEHCLIGTEDLLVFEQSIDPKGMDQDLVFIYQPDPAA